MKREKLFFSLMLLLMLAVALGYLKLQHDYLFKKLMSFYNCHFVIPCNLKGDKKIIHELPGPTIEQQYEKAEFVVQAIVKERRDIVIDVPNLPPRTVELPAIVHGKIVRTFKVSTAQVPPVQTHKEHVQLLVIEPTKMWKGSVGSIPKILYLRQWEPLTENDPYKIDDLYSYPIGSQRIIFIRALPDKEDQGGIPPTGLSYATGILIYANAANASYIVSFLSDKPAQLLP